MSFKNLNINPHAPVAQKIADQRWLIANRQKIGIFLHKMMWLKGDQKSEEGSVRSHYKKLDNFLRNERLRVNNNDNH